MSAVCVDSPVRPTPLTLGFPYGTGRFFFATSDAAVVLDHVRPRRESHPRAVGTVASADILCLPVLCLQRTARPMAIGLRTKRLMVRMVPVAPTPFREAAPLAPTIVARCNSLSRCLDHASSHGINRHTQRDASALRLFTDISGLHKEKMESRRSHVATAGLITVSSTVPRPRSHEIRDAQPMTPLCKIRLGAAPGILPQAQFCQRCWDLRSTSGW